MNMRVIMNMMRMSLALAALAAVLAVGTLSQADPVMAQAPSRECLDVAAIADSDGKVRNWSRKIQEGASSCFRLPTAVSQVVFIVAHADYRDGLTGTVNDADNKVVDVTATENDEYRQNLLNWGVLRITLQDGMAYEMTILIRDNEQKPPVSPGDCAERSRSRDTQEMCNATSAGTMPLKMETQAPTGYVVPGYTPPQGQGNGAGQTGQVQQPEPVDVTPPEEEDSGQQKQGDPPPQDQNQQPQPVEQTPPEEENSGQQKQGDPPPQDQNQQPQPVEQTPPEEEQPQPQKAADSAPPPEEPTQPEQPEQTEEPESEPVREPSAEEKLVADNAGDDGCLDSSEYVAAVNRVATETSTNWNGINSSVAYRAIASSRC
jgi:hypothetical protein